MLKSMWSRLTTCPVIPIRGGSGHAMPGLLSIEVRHDQEKVMRPERRMATDERLNLAQRLGQARLLVRIGNIVSQAALVEYRRTGP